MANFRPYDLTGTAIDIANIRNGCTGGSIHNTGANTAYILFDLTENATAVRYTFDLMEGDHYEIPEYLIGRVSAVAPGGATINVTLREENAFI